MFHAPIPHHSPVSSLARFGDDFELTELERRVICLSLQDDAASVATGSIAGRYWRRLLGIRQSNKLADPRLEALRTFAIGYRLGWCEFPAEDDGRFVTDGLEVGTLHAAILFIDHIAEAVMYDRMLID